MSKLHVFIFIVIASCTSAFAADPPADTEPLPTPWAFYESLIPVRDTDMSDGEWLQQWDPFFHNKPNPERDEKIRSYYRRIRDASPEDKVKAVQLIYGVYVHVIPERLTAELLAPMLEDENREVRIEAARAAASCREIHKLADPLLKLFEEEHDELTIVTMRAAGYLWRDPRAVEIIIAHLEHDNPLVRASAVEALGMLSPQALKHSIPQLRKDEAWQVRRAVIKHLHSGSLNSMLDDSEAKVRHAAIQVISTKFAARDTGGTWRSNVNRLHRFLEHPKDGPVALKALARMGDHSIVPLAIDWLTQEDWARRDAALKVVMMFEAKSALSTLRKLENHEDERFASDVQHVLRRIESVQQQEIQ